MLTPCVFKNSVGKGIYSANVFALILRFRFIIDISKFCGATDKDNDFLRNYKTVTISYELMYFVLSLSIDIFVSISSETVGIFFKFTFFPLMLMRVFFLCRILTLLMISQSLQEHKHNQI